MQWSARSFRQMKSVLEHAPLIVSLDRGTQDRTNRIRTGSVENRDELQELAATCGNASETRRDEMQILDDAARGCVGQAELSTVRHRSQEQGA